MTNAVRQAQSYLRQTASYAQGRDVDPAGAGAAMCCVTATNGSYPTTAKAVYVVTPEDIDADDTEGAAATYTPDTNSNFFAVGLGTAIPPQGTRVVCHSVGGRWVFLYDG